MEEKMVKVYNAKDDVEAQMIMDFLEDNDVHSRKQSPGSGEYLKVYMGMSPMGLDIFVWEHDSIKAKDLIEAFYQAEIIEEEFSE